MKIILKCPVYPTEDRENVEYAIKRLFGEIELTLIESGQHIELVSIHKSQTSLSHLRQLIFERRIIDAVRVRLLKNSDQLSTRILFDKQAAFTGKPRLLDDSSEDPPLGAIEIEITFDSQNQFDEFLSWFSPRTEKGRIVS